MTPFLGLKVMFDTRKKGGDMIGARLRHTGCRITQFICLGLLFSGLFAPGRAWPRSLAEIRKTNELRICVAGSSYELYTAMALAFAEHLGVSPRVKRLDSWDQQFQNDKGVTDKEAAYTPALMDSGDCDCYPNDVVKNDWRLKKLDFVILFRTRMVVVVNKDNQSAYKSVAGLAGKNAAIQKGTSYHSWLENQNAGPLASSPIQIQFMTTDESMQAVDAKSADFTIIGADGALNWTRNRVKNVVVAFPVGDTTELGWAFRKKDRDLQEAVRRFFDSQAAVGSRFDDIWKEKVGIPLSEFNVFITGLLQE
jgi:membrane-bound lytic murein transglycosylase MltF